MAGSLRGIEMGDCCCEDLKSHESCCTVSKMKRWQAVLALTGVTLLSYFLPGSEIFRLSVEAANAAKLKKRTSY